MFGLGLLRLCMLVKHFSEDFVSLHNLLCCYIQPTFLHLLLLTFQVLELLLLVFALLLRLVCFGYRYVLLQRSSM
jgi:hypothetical protein